MTATAQERGVARRVLERIEERARKDPGVSGALLWCADLLRAELGATSEPTPMLFEPDCPPAHSVTLPFLPMSLKNGQCKMVVRRKGGGVGLIDTADARAQKARLVEIIERSVRPFRQPLFGQDEVARDLVWDTQRGEVTVTWRVVRAYRPDDRRITIGRSRDVNSMGAIVDDCAGRPYFGRKPMGKGFIYRNDSQLCETTERRI